MFADRRDQNKETVMEEDIALVFVTYSNFFSTRYWFLIGLSELTRRPSRDVWHGAQIPEVPGHCKTNLTPFLS